MEIGQLFTSAFLITWLAASLRLAGPVLLASLGEIFGELSGVLNIGIEGTILLGAVTNAEALQVALLLEDGQELALGPAELRMSSASAIRQAQGQPSMPFARSCAPRSPFGSRSKSYSGIR